MTECEKVGGRTGREPESRGSPHLFSGMKEAMAKDGNSAGLLNLSPLMSQFPRSPGLKILSYISSGDGRTLAFTCIKPIPLNCMSRTSFNTFYTPNIQKVLWKANEGWHWPYVMAIWVGAIFKALALHSTKIKFARLLTLLHSPEIKFASRIWKERKRIEMSSFCCVAHHFEP